MPLNNCLFAVRLPDERLRQTVERRLETLDSFYAPLGPVRRSARWIPELKLVTGVVRFDGEQRDPTATLAWGGSLEPDLADARGLAYASDDRLRSLPNTFAGIAVDGGSARLVTSGGGVTSLYFAKSDAIEAWSSHAVAAGWLARGAVELDLEQVPDLIAMGFVGDDRTLIRGVRAVPPAARITITAAGVAIDSFWAEAERWAPVPPEDASQRAEEELLLALDRALGGAPHPVLGLTAGMDSRTVLLALRELGIQVTAFTMGASHDPDVIGAARACAVAGAEHRARPIVLWDDDDGLERVHAEVRWTEGCMPVGYGHVEWPNPMSHWVTGLDGETGRARYYEWAYPRNEAVSTRTLERALLSRFEENLLGAEPGAIGALRTRARKWIAEVGELGHTGWGCLDVVWGRNNVPRWGRGWAPRLTATLVHGFCWPPVMSALASLPLRDRLMTGFQRGFIGSRHPELLEPQTNKRRPVVSPLAQKMATIRLRRLRRGLRVPRLSRSPSPRWFEVPPFSDHPRYIEWLTDEVLVSPVLAEAVGDRWLSELRTAFLRGQHDAGELTRSAASVVALSNAIQELGWEPESALSKNQLPVI